MSRSGAMYAALADYYDTVVLGWSGAARAATVYVQNLPFARNEYIQVLDVGCGTGLYALAILEHFPHANIWAFDNNQAMIRTLRQKLQERGMMHRANLFVCDMAQLLPVPVDTRFDLMIASGALEYGNLTAILNNILPYLKRGGYFFDAAIRDTFAGRILGSFWGCKPSSQHEICDACNRAGLVLVLVSKLPSSYLLLYWVKVAYLFKKPG